MKTLAPRRQKNITLKQYMHNTSLKKKLTSRSKSKQKRQLSIHETNKNVYEVDMSKLKREKMIDQIKLQLVRTIKDQIALNQILRMLNRLIQTYNSELYDKQKENGLLETMIQERMSTNNTLSKKIQELNLKNSGFTNVKLLTTNYESDPLNKSEKSRRGSIQIQQNRKYSSASSEEIPNINVLLMTRNEPLFDRFKELQTQQTLVDHAPDALDNQSSDVESKIQIQINQSRDCETSFFNKSLANSNAYNRIKVGSAKKEETQLKDSSIHSSFWKKNNPNSSVLSRFEDLKRRLDK